MCWIFTIDTEIRFFTFTDFTGILVTKRGHPVTGCTKIKDGCLPCYAESLAKRIQATGDVKYHLGVRSSTTRTRSLRLALGAIHAWC